MRESRSWTVVPCTLNDVGELCAQYHGYKSIGKVSVYNFGVYEDSRLVAGYSWLPCSPGAARSLSPSAPGGVLTLSRMVAVPSSERHLRHISKPLRHIMNRSGTTVLSDDRIDRGRWPVLVTYSDESLGHTGHTYKCSGWNMTARVRNPYITTSEGERRSVYSAGSCRTAEISGYRYIQRWEHRVCPEGEEMAYMNAHGWYKVPVPGKFWKSGNQMHTYKKVE